MPFTTLISAKELAQHYDDCIVIDCRFALDDVSLGESLYQQGHLPDARYADLDKHLSSPITASSGRHPLPDFDKLIAQLGNWGIDHHAQVVAYDDMSGFYASRLWWLLRTLGHQNVAVLDGGIQAWQATVQRQQTKLPSISPCQYTAKLNRHAWRDVNELQQHIAADDCVLIDARAKERFAGSNEPIDPIAGHIPSAVNYPITENLNDEGKFLDSGSLRKHYQHLINKSPADKVVHYCGSGVFSCFAILAMEIAGLYGSKLYPGSWSEWIRDPARGVATNKGK